MPENLFLHKLTKQVIQARYNDYNDNYDTIQLGNEPPRAAPMWRQCAGELKTRIKEFFSPVINPLKPYLRPVKRALFYYFLPKRFFKHDLLKFEDFSFLYELLGNQDSRDLLVQLCAYRILGHRKIKLARNYPAYWRDIKDIEKYRTSKTPIKIKFMDINLFQYDLTPIGFCMKVHATEPGSACTFIQKQYEYHKNNTHCKADDGDIVIDAGGCWGETTMYFAHEVGKEGRVVSFEFIPSNLKIMHINLEENPELTDRVILIENPIWSTSNLKLYYVDDGPGSRVTSNENQYKYDGITETISIDDMVEQRQLPRVDFIKMDIEGAELEALYGAERTIKAYHPKLAISLYHQPSDFVTIPKYLARLGLDYDFYLDHHTIYQNETVLFALPRKNHNA